MINSLFMSKEKEQELQGKKTAEIVVLLVYIALYVVVSAFHEPWFDEAQAWQIARGVSFKDILLTVGHYEGHPFLWYYILAIPAKLGVPFEIGLKSIGLLISAASAFLCIFKAPFPKRVRLILPFTYFFFYQYGIIVRPYGLTLLLLLLTAIAFKDKDTRPWPVAILLMLQCILNAYGMVLAGGIAICWVIDILLEFKASAFGIGEMLRDRRILPLFCLLIAAGCVLLTIYPYPDTYTAADDGTNSKLSCFIAALFTFLGDSLITTSPFFSADTSLLQTAELSAGFIATGGYIGIVLAAAIISFSSKKKVKYFIIPYILFVAFSSLVYFQIHHIGIFAVYMLFWSWIDMDDPGCCEIGKILLDKLKGADKNKSILTKVGVGIIYICILVGFYWSVGSAALDLQYQYSYGRETSKFLKESGLDQLKVAALWREYALAEGEERSAQNINTGFTGLPTLLLAYYDHNFVYTFHNGKEIGYTTYMQPNPQVNEANLSRWREQGIPEVLIGGADVAFLTDGAVTLDDYAPVFELQMNYIFKAEVTQLCNYVFLRRDLLEQYGIEEIGTPDSPLIITDDMKERYDNGESVESILEPYFKKTGLLPDE